MATRLDELSGVYFMRSNKPALIIPILRVSFEGLPHVTPRIQRPIRLNLCLWLARTAGQPTFNHGTVPG